MKTSGVTDSERVATIETLFTLFDHKTSIYAKNVFGARMIERALSYSTHPQFMGFLSELYTFLEAADEEKFASFVNHRHASHVIQTIVSLIPRAVALDAVQSVSGPPLDAMFQALAKWICDGNFINDEPGETGPTCGSHVLRSTLRVVCGMPAMDERRAARRHIAVPAEHAALPAASRPEWGWGIIKTLVGQISTDADSVTFLQEIAGTPSGSAALQEVFACLGRFPDHTDEAAALTTHLTMCILKLGIDAEGLPDKARLAAGHAAPRNWCLHGWGADKPKKKGRGRGPTPVNGDDKGRNLAHLTAAAITALTDPAALTALHGALPAGDALAALLDDTGEFGYMAGVVLPAFAGHQTWAPPDHGLALLQFAEDVAVDVASGGSRSHGAIDVAMAVLTPSPARLAIQPFQEALVATMRRTLKAIAAKTGERASYIETIVTRQQDAWSRVRVLTGLLKAGLSAPKLLTLTAEHLGNVSAAVWLRLATDPAATAIEGFMATCPESGPADAALRHLTDVRDEVIVTKGAYLLAKVVCKARYEVQREWREYLKENKDGVYVTGFGRACYQTVMHNPAFNRVDSRPGPGRAVRGGARGGSGGGFRSGDRDGPRGGSRGGFRGGSRGGEFGGPRGRGRGRGGYGGYGRRGG